MIRINILGRGSLYARVCTSYFIQYLHFCLKSHNLLVGGQLSEIGETPLRNWYLPELSSFFLSCIYFIEIQNTVRKVHSSWTFTTWVFPCNLHPDTQIKKQDIPGIPEVLTYSQLNPQYPHPPYPTLFQMLLPLRTRVTSCLEQHRLTVSASYFISMET